MLKSSRQDLSGFTDGQSAVIYVSTIQKKWLHELQKQSFADVLQNRCSKFYKRTTPVLKSLFIRIADPKAFNFIKKRLQRMRFPVKFPKFLRAPFFTEHLRWLLLELQ